MNPKILLIYTGGTIGSFQDYQTGHLKPLDFAHLQEFIPELQKLNLDLEVEAFDTPIDSSNIHTEHWVDLVQRIERRYAEFDGFVILHGTDTMSYTASALSFLLEGLDKPVILTGSQLPIGMIRTDGKENLITALEIAAMRNAENRPMVPEVCIYFEFKLYRGNRTFKYSSEHFKAYQSPNYPLLGEAGVEIEIYRERLLQRKGAIRQFHKNLDTNILLLKLFPGIGRQGLENVSRTPGIRAIIVETYGFGNGPLDDWFFTLWKEITQQGILVVNITQCHEGRVVQGKYETSRAFVEAGALDGADLTTEAAITKMMYLLGRYQDPTIIKQEMVRNLSGELTAD